MKVPPIKSSSLEEFNKLPRTEQLKYRARGALIDAVNKNSIGLCCPVHLAPTDTHTYWATLLASIERICKK